MNPFPSGSRVQQLKIVIVGHVDHGKSTFVGRLFHDTGTLPEGKLEQLRQVAERRGVPFEWANLMDALQSERDQNITIDTAQIWFRTAKRQYVIIDAPGHKEFLKNMVTGAANAEAALLLIDAHEGVQENSRRHGYLLHLLGVRQLAVLVNKMDLAQYSRARFQAIEREYRAWLSTIGLTPQLFIPIVARDGDNIATPSPNMPWWDGPRSSKPWITSGPRNRPSTSPFVSPSRMSTDSTNAASSPAASRRGRFASATVSSSVRTTSQHRPVHRTLAGPSHRTRRCR
jgi:bifunctional enzyme CysN/CysC